MFNYKKKFILLLSVIIFIISSYIPVITNAFTNVKTDENTAVTFKDSTLEEYIRKTIDKPSGYITQKDLESINNICLNFSKKLTNLEGLQYCTNLTTFYADVETSDMSQLSNLTNLDYILLYNDKITNLDFLKNLKKINSLHLTCSNLKNADALQSLTKLTELYITSNNISNLKSVKMLTDLETLQIDCKNLNTLEGFEYLEKLDFLCLSNSNVKDFYPIKNLNNLCHVVLSNNPNLLNAFKYLNNIKTLAIGGKDIYSLSGIENCRNLTDLYLRSTSILDLSPIKSLNKLETLGLSDSPVDNSNNYKILDNLTNLTTLSIENCNLTRIPLLKNLHNLCFLNLYHNYINSLNGIENFPSLCNLELEDNEISDLAPLVEFSKNRPVESIPIYINLSYNLIPKDDEYMDNLKNSLNNIDLCNGTKKTDMHLLTINNCKYIYTSPFNYFSPYKVSANRNISLVFNENINVLNNNNNIKIYNSTLDKYYDVNFIVNENTLEIKPLNTLPLNDNLYLYIGSDFINGIIDYKIPITIEKDSSADVNKDGTVDLNDLSIAANDYNKQADGSDDWNVYEDCVRDGIIDIYDICYISSRLSK